MYWQFKSGCSTRELGTTQPDEVTTFAVFRFLNFISFVGALEDQVLLRSSKMAAVEGPDQESLPGESICLRLERRHRPRFWSWRCSLLYIFRNEHQKVPSVNHQQTG